MTSVSDLNQQPGVNAIQDPAKQNAVLEVLSNGYITVNDPKSIPVQELLNIDPQGGSTYVTTNGGTSGQKKMVFYLPSGPSAQDLVAQGSHMIAEFGTVTTSITGGTVVANSGAALPCGIAALVDQFVVKVGNTDVHNIPQNFGLLKRKLTDLCANQEWINGYGGVKSNYVLDPESDGTVTGAVGYRGFNKLYSNTVANLRYQFDLLPNGFLDRELPLGALQPIQIWLVLVNDPLTVMGFNYTVAPTAVTVTITNPKIYVPCYRSKEVHARILANFKGYYDDWDYQLKQIAAASTSLTHNLPISRKSVSGLIGVFRVQADINRATNAGNDGSAYVLLDKQGQCSTLGMSQYYFRFNGQVLPVGQQLDATQGLIPYEYMQKFQHDYADALRDSNYYVNSSNYFCNSSIGQGGFAISATAQKNLYYGPNQGGYIGRFTLFHSFRADEWILQGLAGGTGDNNLIVQATINSTACTNAMQADYFMRFDTFFSIASNGGIIISS